MEVRGKGYESFAGICQKLYRNNIYVMQIVTAEKSSICLH
jgi:hypothetical protein